MKGRWLSPPRVVPGGQDRGGDGRDAKPAGGDDQRVQRHPAMSEIMPAAWVRRSRKTAALAQTVTALVPPARCAKITTTAKGIACSKRIRCARCTQAGQSVRGADRAKASAAGCLLTPTMQGTRSDAARIAVRVSQVRSWLLLGPRSPFDGGGEGLP